jgi:hypothetical protein
MECSIGLLPRRSWTIRLAETQIADPEGVDVTEQQTSARAPLLQILLDAKLVVSALVALSAAGYLIGSLYWHAYWDAFDASWLANEMPTTRLLAAGVFLEVPVALAFLLAAILRVSEKREILGPLLSFSWWCLLVAWTIGGILVSLKEGTLNLPVVLADVLLYILASFIYYLAAEYEGHRTNWQRLGVVALCSFLLLVYVDFVMGAAERAARQAVLPTKSGLPEVRAIMADKQTETLRLALSAEGRFYLARLRADKPPEILVVGPERVESITCQSSP